jgi:hypothetical protein
VEQIVACKRIFSSVSQNERSTEFDPLYPRPVLLEDDSNVLIYNHIIFIIDPFFLHSRKVSRQGENFIVSLIPVPIDGR